MKKHVFNVFFLNLQINVFNIYDLSPYAGAINVPMSMSAGAEGYFVLVATLLLD